MSNRKEYMKNWFAEHPDYMRKWKEEHKEEVNRYQREYRKANPEIWKTKGMARIKEWQQRNKEKLAAPHDCACGGKYTHAQKSTHLKTKKHQEWLKSNPTVDVGDVSPSGDVPTTSGEAGVV